MDNIIYLEATNSYLLLSKGSSVRSMDEDGNIDTEPDISFQDDVKVIYFCNLVSYALCIYIIYRCATTKITGLLYQ